VALHILWRSLLFFALAAALGCGDPEGRASGDVAGAGVGATGAGAQSLPAQGEGPGEAGEPVVVFLGNSLTAGFGLPEERAFPALLDARLDEEGLPVRVVNAGVSGDTSAGGLARLDWLLRQDPDVLVVGLGGNDGLRGLSISELAANLRAIVERAQAAGARVVLLGMRMPPNYGKPYTQRFAQVYPAIAKETGAAFVPFLLEGVGGVAELNLPDGIHPTAEGHEVLADNVWPTLRNVVEELPDDE
jgi:acyl-CoA thioesterase-1